MRKGRITFTPKQVGIEVTYEFEGSRNFFDEKPKVVSTH